VSFSTLTAAGEELLFRIKVCGAVAGREPTQRNLVYFGPIQRLRIGPGQLRNSGKNRTKNPFSIIPNKEVISIKHFQFEAAFRV
jgi:hypothetical protein